MTFVAAPPKVPILRRNPGDSPFLDKLGKNLIGPLFPNQRRSGVLWKSDLQDPIINTGKAKGTAIDAKNNTIGRFYPTHIAKAWQNPSYQCW